MKRLYKIVVEGILELGLIFYSFGCAAQKPTRREVIKESKIEKAAISSLENAGISSLINSELNREEQVSVNMWYNRLMGMEGESWIRKEINELAEKKFGGDRYKAYQALFSVLKTVADVNGNQNGIPESQEIDRYYEKFENKPFVELLKKYVQY